MNPNRPFDEDAQRTRFMIPNHPDAREYLDFIKDKWTALYRTDLPETLEEEPKETQRKKRLYSHPDDSLVACILALKASKIRKSWNYVRI